MFFLELFCGTGSLSAAVKKYGVGACTGISSRVTGHTRCPVLPINLGEPTQQPLLWDMLRRDNLCAVHLSPPPSQTGLHSLCADVIEWCHKHGVLVTVEGPVRMLFGAVLLVASVKPWVSLRQLCISACLVPSTPNIQQFS